MFLSTELTYRATVSPWPAIQILDGWLPYAIAAVVLLTLTGLVAVALARRDEDRRRLNVVISNQGNVATCYELRAEAGERGLAFAFALDGQLLTPASTPPMQSHEHPLTPPPHEQAPEPLHAVRRAMAIGGAIADVVSALAAILPASTARPLVEAAGRMRAGQSKASRAVALPEQLVRVKTAGEVASGPRPVSMERSEERSRKAPVGTGITGAPGWTLTPEVGPGQTMELSLLVRRIGPIVVQQPAFVVLSRPAALPATEPVVERGTLSYARTSFAGRIAPYVAVLIMGGMTALAVLWLSNLGWLAR
jgi:hypothetical protein